MNQRDPETYAIIGAAMRVHSELGYGFLESVYQDALEIELKANSIPFQREVRISVCYKKIVLPSYFVADFICYDNTIVELKALSSYSGKEKSQVINYLKATGFPKALLVNFGAESLGYESFVNQF